MPLTIPQRRSGDSPRQHAIRFVASLAYGALLLAGAITLRALGLIGEGPLVILVLAAGVVVNGERLVCFVKAWRRSAEDA